VPNVQVPRNGVIGEWDLELAAAASRLCVHACVRAPDNLGEAMATQESDSLREALNGFRFPKCVIGHEVARSEETKVPPVIQRKTTYVHGQVLPQRGRLLGSMGARH
jgi:hypothetical protein